MSKMGFMLLKFCFSVLVSPDFAIFLRIFIFDKQKVVFLISLFFQSSHHFEVNLQLHFCLVLIQR